MIAAKSAERSPAGVVLARSGGDIAAVEWGELPRTVRQPPSTREWLLLGRLERFLLRGRRVLKLFVCVKVCIRI